MIILPCTQYNGREGLWTYGQDAEDREVTNQMTFITCGAIPGTDMVHSAAKGGALEESKGECFRSHWGFFPPWETGQ